MTAICYSQLTGFRSPWGGAGRRCWQEAGWFTGPPPPPVSPNTELPLHVSPLCLLLLLFCILRFSPSSFFLYSMSIALSPHLHLYFQPTFTCFNPPLHSLYSMPFLLYMAAIGPLKEDNEIGDEWMKWCPNKVINRDVLIVIDTVYGGN